MHSALLKYNRKIYRQDITTMQQGIYYKEESLQTKYGGAFGSIYLTTVKFP